MWSHRSSLRATLVVTLAAMLALTGCSLTSSTSSKLEPGGDRPVNAPTLPISALKPLADQDRDVRAKVLALGASPGTVVAVGNVEGNVTVPLFRWSDDVGTTWNPGELSDAAAKTTEIGETSLGLVAFGNNTWVSLGSKGDTVVAWTSTNGRTWERSVATGIDGRRARVNDLTGTKDGFVIVGSLSEPDGQHSIPYAWTSTDGVAWQAIEVTKTRGDLSSVAQLDNTLVAVGALPLDETNSEGRFGYAGAYFSTNGGKTWTKADSPEPEGANSYAELVGVVATTSGFVAAGYYEQQRYRGYAMTSVDGQTWTALPALESTQSLSITLDLLVVDNKPLVLIEDRSSSDSKVELHGYRLEGSAWVTADLPEQLPSYTLTDAVGVGPVALLGLTWSDPVARAAVWRSPDGGTTWDKQLSNAPASFTARLKPQGLMLYQGAEWVYGDAQGKSVIWTRDEGGFTPPTIILDGQRPGMEGIAAGPKSLLMWGREDVQAWVAISTDGGKTWTQTTDDVFSITSDYAWSDIDAAVWLEDRWLVVGTYSTNGDARVSALAFTSTDGKTWQYGVPTTSRVQADDGFDGLPVLSDLDGVYRQERHILEVAEVGAEAVAVGWASKDSVKYPVWWTSSQQGHKWLMTPLPTPGVTSAIAGEVSVDGEQLTVVGVADMPGGLVQMPCTWVSSDGGKTWSFTVHEDWGEASYLGLESNGKELLAVLASKDHTTITLWRSTDQGATWTKTPVPVPGLGQGVNLRLISTLVIDGELHLLIGIQNRLDGVSVVQTVALT